MDALIQTKSGKNYLIEATGTNDIENFVDLINKYVTTTLIVNNSFNKNIDGDLWRSMSQGISGNLKPEKTDAEKLTDLTENLITLVNTLCTKESYKINNIWCVAANNKLSQRYPIPTTI